MIEWMTCQLGNAIFNHDNLVVLVMIVLFGNFVILNTSLITFCFFSRYCYVILIRMLYGKGKH